MRISDWSSDVCSSDLRWRLVRKTVESSLSFSGRDSPAGRIEFMAVKPSRIIGERGITLVTDALQYNGDVPRDVLTRFAASIDERGEGGVEPRIARGKTEGHSPPSLKGDRPISLRRIPHLHGLPESLP